METITLFYLALGVAFMLLIIVAGLFKRNNILKNDYESIWKHFTTSEQELVKAEKRLEQYEKTNIEQIKEINELSEECDRYLTSSNGYRMKCDKLDKEIDAYATKISEYELENIKIKANLDDQADFISSLNERVQKAEAERDKLKHSNKVLQETHANVLDECERLYSENSKLNSKLSRKGTGVKGSKKKEVVFNNDSDESCITEVEFEEQKYVEITRTAQLEQYVGYKFECVLELEDEFVTFSGKLISHGNVFILAFNGTTGWELSESERILADNTYNKGWGVFNEDFGDIIKSLKILL